MKSYGDKMADFYDKKLNPSHTCLAVISLNLSLKKDRNYYLQSFLNILRKK